ncbi:MAG: PP2C family protein-serine/threonine phosphatase [Flavobacteriales bacterium]
MHRPRSSGGFYVDARNIPTQRDPGERGDLTPGAILDELRDRVVRELSGSDPEYSLKDGMDAAIVKIPIANSNSDPKGQDVGGHSVGRGFKLGREEDEIQVEFAGAQNPLYVIRKGIVEEGVPVRNDEQDVQDRSKPFRKSSDGIEIKGDPHPVGYDEHAEDPFTTFSLDLKRGDMLYIFSDGYADQFGGYKGKKFRYGPFKELLAKIHQEPLEEQKKELDRTFEEWKDMADHEQIDDVVLIGIKLG